MKKTSSHAESASSHIRTVEEIEALRRKWQKITGGRASSLLDTRPVDAQGIPIGDLPEEAHQAFQHRSDAVDLWYQLTYDLIGWALWDGVATDLSRRKKDAGLAERGQEGRMELWSAVHLALAHRPIQSADPCIAILSPDIAVSLLNALRALDRNELQPLLWTAGKPTTKPITANHQAQRTAIQSIAYLEGKGISTTEAQESVAAAYGLGAEAVRKWEQEQKRVADPFVGAMRKMMAYSDRAAAFLAGLRGVHTDTALIQSIYATWRAKRLKDAEDAWFLEFDEVWPRSTGMLVEEMKDYRSNGAAYLAANRDASAQREGW